MNFEIITPITGIEVIAIGNRIRDIRRLEGFMEKPAGGNSRERRRFA
jgi:hypothetical protein